MKTRTCMMITFDLILNGRNFGLGLPGKLAAINKFRTNLKPASPTKIGKDFSNQVANINILI